LEKGWVRARSRNRSDNVGEIAAVSKTVEDAIVHRRIEENYKKGVEAQLAIATSGESFDAGVAQAASDENENAPPGDSKVKPHGNTTMIYRNYILKLAQGVPGEKLEHSDLTLVHDQTPDALPGLSETRAQEKSIEPEDTEEGKSKPKSFYPCVTHF
jgi:hypothetical protein